MPRLARMEIERIIALRKRGHSLPEIRRATGHSNGTIFYYIKGIAIDSEFIEYWRNKRRSSVLRRMQALEKARDQANKIIRVLDRKEKLLILITLYWAEGSKRDLQLVNTDPFLIKVFIECLSALGITRDHLTISLRLYEDIDREKAIKFWTKETGISRDKISYIDIKKGNKKGKLPYGMCRVRVSKGGFTLKLIYSLIEKVVHVVVPNSPIGSFADYFRPRSSTDRTGDS